MNASSVDMFVSQRWLANLMFVIIGITIGLLLAFFQTPSVNFEKLKWQQFYSNDNKYGDPHMESEVDDSHAPEKALYFHENLSDPHTGKCIYYNSFNSLFSDFSQ